MIEIIEILREHQSRSDLIILVTTVVLKVFGSYT